MLNSKGLTFGRMDMTKLSVFLMRKAHIHFPVIRKYLGSFFKAIMETTNAVVLDIGFGTGTLTNETVRAGLLHLWAGLLGKNDCAGV